MDLKTINFKEKTRHKTLRTDRSKQVNSCLSHLLLVSRYKLLQNNSFKILLSKLRSFGRLPHRQSNSPLQLCNTYVRVILCISVSSQKYGIIYKKGKKTRNVQTTSRLKANQAVQNNIKQVN